MLTEIKQLSKLNTSQKIHLHELKAKSLLGLGKSGAAINEINRLMVAIAKDNSTFRFPESIAEDFTPGAGINDAETLVRLAEAWRVYHGRYSMEEEKLDRKSTRLNSSQ